jgi:hypothetical protein
MKTFSFGAPFTHELQVGYTGNTERIEPVLGPNVAVCAKVHYASKQYGAERQDETKRERRKVAALGGNFRNWDCQKSEGAQPKPLSDLVTCFVS